MSLGDYAHLINLTPGSDTFYWWDENDGLFSNTEFDAEIHGLGGLDHIEGDNGPDLIYGENGNDELYGGINDGTEGEAGSDKLYGGFGNDKLYGFGGADTLDGGPDGDELHGGNQVDLVSYLDAGAGVKADFLLAGTNIGDAAGDTYFDVENLQGSNFADTLLGDNNPNQIFGEGGNDTLDGRGGDDILWGGPGDDNLMGGEGQDSFQGGVDGLDTANYSNSPNGLSAYLKFPGANTGYAAGDGYVSIEGLIGSQFNDLLGGNDVGNIILGGAGHDEIAGYAGADQLFGENGDDTLWGGLDPDHLDGGNGIDTASYSEAPDGIIADLTLQFGTGYAAGDSWTSIENLEGTAQSDSLGGDGFANVLMGGGGNDELWGYGGNDDLKGEAGNDTLYGGPGADHFDGGTQSDIVSYWGGAGPVTVNLFSGQGTGGDAAGDTYFEVEHIQGSGYSDVLLGDIGANTIWGGFGNDTISGSNGGDYLLGEGDSDTLSGGFGNDTLDGGADIDSMYGNDGDDTYYVDSIGDSAIENPNGGYDVVFASDNFVLSDNVEDLILRDSGGAIYGAGNAGNNYITGNSSANSLAGYQGDDHLDGGGGADIMIGGSGVDTYYVDSAGDQIFEFPGEGIDWVEATVSYSLGADVENLFVTGTDNIDATGNALDNIIGGNGGNNTLDGGAGADKMTGNGGNDVYIVDNAADKVFEEFGDGIDTVKSSVDFVLGFNFEDLVLLSGAIHGTGNNLNNTISGNTAGNVLDGGSGGIDFLYGGLGNDVYLIHGGNQAAIENVNEGLDTVKTDIDYELGSNVEDLQLLAGAISGTGNSLSNLITGNNADNTLDGGSGGTDVLYGGIGNDVYIIHTSASGAFENPGEGFDTVKTDVDYALGSNVEDLVLLAGAISGTGNNLANTITGNNVANTLDGGTGVDMLYGGLGNDVYIIHNSASGAIENVNEGTDTVKTDVDYVLGSNVEDLVLLPGAVSGTGNNLSNLITGNSADNTLDGGTGVDMLYGGLGNDIYIIHNAASGAFENPGGGFDTVKADVGYVLGSNIENLVLTGAGAINGTGNNLDNDITGNSAGNILDGGGGGEDVLFGGGGGDTLFGNSPGDQLYGGIGDDLYYLSGGATGAYENPGEGTDWVFTAADYSLGSPMENLQLLGSGNFNGIGNTLDNMIFSNGASCTLFGGAGNDTLIGGTGVDTMYGSIGTDLYYVHNSAAAALENPGEGTDWVYADVSFTLGSNIENIVLTGAGNVDATGNAANNRIEGNTGNNNLIGNGGADTFVFAAAGTHHDTIYDFDAVDASAGHDLIDLSGRNLSFAGLTINQVGADIQILIGGDEITLKNVTSVNAGDFLF